MCRLEQKGLETVGNWSVIGHLYQWNRSEEKENKVYPVIYYVWGNGSNGHCKKDSDNLMYFYYFSFGFLLDLLNWLNFLQIKEKLHYF